MADINRRTIVLTVLVSLGTATQLNGQFEVDDRVPTGDCPGCIGVPHAGVITGVEDIVIVDGASESILHQGGFDEDVSMFLDRNESQRTDILPTELIDADYIETSQNNADWVTSNGMEIDIAIDVIPGGIVYVFIDTPEIENNGGSVPFHWMDDPTEWDGNVFFDTGSSFGAPFLGVDPGPGDRQFYVYAVGPLNGGTYHIREQDVDSTYLGIAALLGSLGVVLQPGDADRDLDFDQLDLVQVQIAAKYLTGQPATWGEGDWDGAPGGSREMPPAGSGMFDQLDIIAALNAGKYLTGPAVRDGGAPDDAQTSVSYNPSTGEVAVDAPAGTELTSVNIDSAGGIFTGDAAANLGGSFDNDADNNIFKATFGGSFGSLSFGNVAQTGLSKQLVLGDLTVVGSLAGGGDLGAVDLIYVPEPASALLLGVGLAIGLLQVRRANH